MWEKLIVSCIVYIIPLIITSILVFIINDIIPYNLGFCSVCLYSILYYYSDYTVHLLV